MDKQIKMIEATIKYLDEKPWRSHPDFVRIKRERQNGTLDPATYHDRISVIMTETSGQ